MRQIALCFLVSLFCVNCATTNSKKRLELATAGFVAGAVLGNATAPKDERPEQHAIYWGAIIGLGGAIAGNWLYNDDQELLIAKQENSRIKAELDLIQLGPKTLIDQGKGKFKNPVGETSLQGQKAQWKVYQLDRWQADGQNHLYHQDQMIEVTPLEK